MLVQTNIVHGYQTPGPYKVEMLFNDEFTW